MVILSEENDLRNERCINSNKTWMKCIELGMTVSLICSFFLFFRLTNTKNELEKVTSQLHELQKNARASSISIGQMEYNIYSIRSLNKVVSEKIEQFESDLVEFKKRNMMEGSTEMQLKLVNNLEHEGFQVTLNNVTTFHANGLNNDKSLRNLQVERSYNPCGELNYFQIVIDVDHNYNETSWKLMKVSDDFANELVVEGRVLERIFRKPYQFTHCIKDGSYIFTIYDSYGDGISCGKRGKKVPCYRMHINNEDVDGSLFSSEFSHSFAISPIDKTVCVGNVFEVNLNLDDRFNGAMWQLSQLPNSVRAKGMLSESSGSFHYSTCIDPGYYHFMVTDSNEEEIFCEREDKKCFEIRIDGELIESIRLRPNMRQSFFVSIEGVARSPRCLLKPILAPVNELNLEYDQRIESVMNIITSLSSVKSLNDKVSPQYQAACFILFDDEVEMTASNRFIVDRYVMSVLLFATHRYAFVDLPANTCNYRDVKCDERGHITRINWCKYALNHSCIIHYMLNSNSSFGSFEAYDFF